jgi:hypothetical protein
MVNELDLDGASLPDGRLADHEPHESCVCVSVFMASVLLGTVYVKLGLVAAMVAHTVIDLVTLTMLRPVRT